MTKRFYQFNFNYWFILTIFYFILLLFWAYQFLSDGDSYFFHALSHVIIFIMVLYKFLKTRTKKTYIWIGPNSINRTTPNNKIFLCYLSDIKNIELAENKVTIQTINTKPVIIHSSRFHDNDREDFFSYITELKKQKEGFSSEKVKK